MRLCSSLFFLTGMDCKDFTIEPWFYDVTFQIDYVSASSLDEENQHFISSDAKLFFPLSSFLPPLSNVMKSISFCCCCSPFDAGWLKAKKERLLPPLKLVHTSKEGTNFFSLSPCDVYDIDMDVVRNFLSSRQLWKLFLLFLLLFEREREREIHDGREEERKFWWMTSLLIKKEEENWDRGATRGHKDAGACHVPLSPHPRFWCRRNSSYDDEREDIPDPSDKRKEERGREMEKDGSSMPFVASEEGALTSQEKHLQSTSISERHIRRWIIQHGEPPKPPRLKGTHHQISFSFPPSFLFYNTNDRIWSKGEPPLPTPCWWWPKGSTICQDRLLSLSPSFCFHF